MKNEISIQEVVDVLLKNSIYETASECDIKAVYNMVSHIISNNNLETWGYAGLINSAIIIYNIKNNTDNTISITISKYTPKDSLDNNDISIEIGGLTNSNLKLILDSLNNIINKTYPEI